MAPIVACVALTDINVGLRLHRQTGHVYLVEGAGPGFGSMPANNNSIRI